jgi:hypothetical protein
MADIVKRLRREVPHCENQSDYGESDLLILSAADEIERLREALLQIAGKVSQSDKSFDGDMASDIARAALGEGKE